MALILGFILIFTLQNYGINVDCSMQKKVSTVEQRPSKVLTLAKEAENRGDFETAINLITQLARKYETAFGSENPEFVYILHCLFRTHLNANNYEEALSFGWKSYKLQAKVHGKEDFDTIQTLSQLGKIYLIRKKFGKAEELLKRAYRLTKSQLGQNHKETIHILFDLAQVYRLTNLPENLPVALRYFQKVYDARSKDPEMGDRHPETLKALKNLGLVLFQQNKMTEAADVFQNILNMQTQTQNAALAEDHEFTKEVKKYLFFALSNSGRPREARQILGKEHRQNYNDDDEILLTLVLLRAEALAKEGKHAQALVITRESYNLVILKPVLSPLTIAILDKLISYSEILGDWDETLEWARVILELVESQRILIIIEEERLNLVSLQLFSFELFIQVSSLENDEEKIDEYYKKAKEAFQPFEHSVALLEKFLHVVKRVADFKAKIGNIGQALSLYQTLAQNPHHCAISSAASASMTQLVQETDSCQFLEGDVIECLVQA